MEHINDDNEWPPREPEPAYINDEYANRTYIEFVKAFSPVLLHLSGNNIAITRDINELKGLTENDIPNNETTERVRNWVDTMQDTIDAMTPDEITQIFETANVARLEDRIYANDYSMNQNNKRGRDCAITMEPIPANGYYVDFLDSGIPYTASAIIQYYKLLHTKPRDEWRTPLRNPISEADEVKLNDLVSWYEMSKRCTRSMRPKSGGKTRKYKNRMYGRRSSLRPRKYAKLRRSTARPRSNVSAKFRK